MMKKWIYQRLKGLFTGLRDRSREGVRRVKELLGDHPFRAKAGGYVALALLIALLGAGTYALRSRSESVPEAALVEPREALAPQIAAPTPQPTPEPVVWAWPLEGEIIGEYAEDEPQWSSTLQLWQTHPALDIAGTPGEAVYACRDGVVADAWQDRLWGNVITIEHDEGYRSTYAGLNTLKLVSVGQAVSMGQVISAMGTAIPCEAELPAHIHFSLEREDAPVDLQALIR